MNATVLNVNIFLLLQCHSPGEWCSPLLFPCSKVSIDQWMCHDKHDQICQRPDTPGEATENEAWQSASQLGYQLIDPAASRGLTGVCFRWPGQMAGWVAQPADSFPRFLSPLATILCVCAVTGPTPRSRAHPEREALHPLRSNCCLSSSRKQ